MTYKNIDQLKKEYPNEEFKRKFKKIFELSILFKGCFLYESFQPSGIFSDAIALTPYGEIFADFLRNIDDTLTDSEIKFLLFLHLYYEDILNDGNYSALPTKSLRIQTAIKVLPGMNGFSSKAP
jgi:hypothetical protein